MNKIYASFMAMLVFFVVFSVFAEDGKMEVNKDGEVRFRQDMKEWRHFTKQEENAYKAPGVEVPINIRQSTSERIDFFHYVPVRKYSEVIVFKDGRLNTISKEGKIYSERKFAVYVVLILVAILFMIVFNVMAWRHKDDISIIVIITAIAIAIAATTTAAIAIAIAAATAAAVATATAAVATATAIAAVATAIAIAIAATIAENKILYIIYVIIFYILIITAMIV